MNYRCRIKICGVRREEDVDLVSASGANYVGLLVNMPSTRTLDPEGAARLAARATIPVALLFMDSPLDVVSLVINEIKPAAAQLQGHESCEYISELRTRINSFNTKIEIWKAVHLPATGSNNETDLETGSETNFDTVLDSMNKYKEAGADKLLLDTIVMVGGKKEMGGTGRTYNWETAARLVAAAPCPVLMAGGLTPENVAQAIRLVKPWALDLASGVEKERGVKDPEKIVAFMREVRDS